MRPHHLLSALWISNLLCCPTGASEGRSGCKVQGDRADCSHLSLREVPADLPGSITSLDVSHNRLVALPAATLAPYPGLLHLDVGHNSIKMLEEGLCGTLAGLRTLNVERNQVHLLTEKDLSRCANLTVLNLAANRLMLKGEPFSALQSLITLDVSSNSLKSAKLGSTPQLPSLIAISLSHNSISTLKKDDFSFLGRSPSLRVLDMSFLPLKSLEDGCFKPVAAMRLLTVDGVNLRNQVAKLSLELSETEIRSLSLKNASLVTLTNTTFGGLEKTNLTFLDLSSSSIGKIESGAFQWLSGLETLYLEGNMLRHLNKETFQGLTSLKKLSLRSAVLKGHTLLIDDFSFAPLNALEEMILEHTPILKFTEQTFTGLVSLSSLDMGWSYCESLRIITDKTFVSLAASPLRKLNLTATAITRIGPGAFSFFGNLTTLLLDFNFIRQTLTGEEFQGLGQLQELFLSNNHQTVTLSPTSFANVTSVRTLTLGKTLTGTLDLDPSPFQCLSDLVYLDLSNNNIANINADLVDGLVKLKVLKLPHNNLARLWKSANPGGPVLFLKGLQSLTVLDMDYTGLDEIPLEALRGLRNLRELSLRGNLLDNLKASVFDDITSLRALRLQKNMITAVRPVVFGAAMENLSLLELDRNPFDCTCESILWFVTWLNRTNASVSGGRDGYVCNTPLAYFNHSIMDFDPLSCKDLIPFRTLYILTSTVVIALILTALLVRFHGWRIQFYWNILINRTLGFSDAKVEEGREFEYDAYVIHADEDVKWVERSLLPLENERYLFCLEDRDSVPGMSRLQSIVSNIRTCRKILFVVTESLLKDRWCGRFQAHQALHQVIEASRDSVVLVFLQDVHDYRLSRSLFLRRGMLRPRCLLYWPVQRERVPAFHQKIRIALGMTNRLQL